MPKGNASSRHHSLNSLGSAFLHVFLLFSIDFPHGCKVAASASSTWGNVLLYSGSVGESKQASFSAIS